MLTSHTTECDFDENGAAYQLLSLNLNLQFLCKVQHNWYLQVKMEAKVGMIFSNRAKCPFFWGKDGSGTDICIQNDARALSCSVVKGHRDSNEAPAGKITSPLCLTGHLTTSEQVNCGRMETLHLGRRRATFHFFTFHSFIHSFISLFICLFIY